MALPRELISEFVKMTKDDTPAKVETNTFGTVVKNGGTTYVKLDGSELLTPVVTTTNIEDGERVGVMIKNHTAIVTGNITSPSARTAEVENVGEEVTQLKGDIANVKILMADKVSTEKLEAQVGRINELVSDNVKINERLEAAEADIANLDVENLDAVMADIKYLKSDEAFVDHLNAITAKINDVVAGRITTDEFYAALADITVLAAGTATFDRATVKHLVAQAMNLEFGVGEQVFVKNLAVEFAQMVSATIGDLCIKASDGNYYLLDVGEDGSVKATKTTVSNSEITAGQTNSGKVILGTDITAGNLNTSNLLATYALVNKIDAARIDVDQLTSREAFITSLFAQEIFTELLRTSKIIGDKTLTLIAGEASDAKSAASSAQSTANSASQTATDAKNTANSASQTATDAKNTATNAQASIDGLEIGGRNLLPFKSMAYDDVLLDGNSTQYIKFRNTSKYSGTYIPHSLLEFETDYVLSYDITCLSGDGVFGGHVGCADKREFYVDGVYIGDYTDGKGNAPQNKKTHATVYLRTCTSDALQTTSSIYIQPQRGSATVIEMDYIIENLKIEKGNKPSDWTPAPEDVDAGIDSAKSIAINALSSVNDLDRLSNIEVIEGAFVQTERRAGEGIHVFSEFGPKRAGSGDPYPAGGGRNKIVRTGETRTQDGITFAVNSDETVTINGTASATTFFEYGNVALKGGTEYKLTTGISQSGVSAKFDKAGLIADAGQVNYTPPSDVEDKIVIRIAGGTSVNNVTVYPMVKPTADTDSTYAPPSNIRPITGYDKLRLNHARKNLLNPSILDDIYAAYASNGINGSIIVNNTSAATVYPKTVWTNLPAGTYTISYTYSGSPAQCYLQQNADDYTLSIANVLKKTITFTKATQVRLLFAVNASYAINATVQFEAGSTATPYEPYQGTDYMLDFGKNLLPVLHEDTSGAGLTFTNDNGVWNIKGTATAVVNFAIIRNTDKFHLPKGRYTFSLGTALTGGVTARVEAYSIESLSWVKTYGNMPAATGEYTLDISGEYYTTMLVSIPSGATVDFSIYPMIRHAFVTDPTYAPYNADMFEQTGGMVYGGKVDWNKGEMMAEWINLTFTGNENFQTMSDIYNGTGRTFLLLSAAGIATPTNIVGDVVCSHYPTRDYNTVNNTAGIICVAAYYTSTHLALRVQFTSTDDWKAFLKEQYNAGTPVQVSYKLAEPYTIQLTPAQMASFEGMNTVYTDANGGRVEFGHDLIEVIDSTMEPVSPKAGALWLDRSMTPAVLRRYNGSEWETVNDVTLIETVQDALLSKQAELEAAQRETALFLKMDAVNKVVRIGQTGLTSEFHIDAFGSGVTVNNEIFSRFEANRVVFGNMEIRRPAVGGLAFDSIVT